MNFLKVNFRYAIIVMASVVLFSCSKAEDGPVGPAGPIGQVGPAGADGANGADGADGANGQNGGIDGTNGQDGADGQNGADGADGEDGQDGAVGTANVIYSELITIKAADWDVSSGGRIWFAQIDELKLTQDIFDSGVVLVYSYSAADGGAYSLMPDGTFTNWVRVNRIGIRRVQQNSPYLPPTDRSFRYVLIPGGVSTSAKSAVDFKKMTFNEVMDHFGLDF